MTQIIRTIIIDDEPLALRLLRSKLEKSPSIEIVAECKNGREAVEAVSDLLPDLIFLDIQMPGMSGLEVIQKLQSDIMPLVVFATAYEQYALDAFDANAIDYMMKPIDSKRVERAVERATQRLGERQTDSNDIDGMTSTNHRKNSLINAIESIKRTQSESLTSLQNEQSIATANKSKIVVKDRDEIHILDQVDIEWIDAAGDYVCIHSKGETYIKRTTLKEILDELDSLLFKRVHRSTIVNMGCIKKVLPHTKGEFFLLLGEYDKIKVSRNYKDVVKEFLSS
jgi:two-component system LytT family response regulator